MSNMDIDELTEAVLFLRLLQMEFFMYFEEADFQDTPQTDMLGDQIDELLRDYPVLKYLDDEN